MLGADDAAAMTFACADLDATAGGAPQALTTGTTLQVNATDGQTITVAEPGGPNILFRYPNGTIGTSPQPLVVTADPSNQGTFEFEALGAGLLTVSCASFTVRPGDPDPEDVQAINEAAEAGFFIGLQNATSVAVPLPSVGSFSGAGDTGAFNGSGDDSGGHFAFNGAVASLDIGSGVDNAQVWVRGSYGYLIDDDGASEIDTHAGRVQFGGDLAVAPRLRLGLAAQGDSFDQDATGVDTLSGVGFLVGPYVAFNVVDGVALQGLAQVGQGYYELDESGEGSVDVDTDRLLLHGGAVGRLRRGPWLIQPAVSATYYAERYASYVSSSGFTRNKSTTTIGMVRFGPRIGYDLVAGDAWVRPSIGLTGVYTFLGDNAETRASGAEGVEGLSGTVSAGVTVGLGPVELDASLSHDGVGRSRFASWTGALSLRAPLP